MKKRVFSLVLALMLAFSVGGAVAETVIGEVYVRQGGGTLNLRAGQSTSTESLGYVHHGEAVEIISLGEEWSWIYVPALEKDGYIKTKYIINIETVEEEGMLSYYIIYPVADLVAGYEPPAEFSVDLDGDGEMDDVIVEYLSVPGEMDKTVVTIHVGDSFDVKTLEIGYNANVYFYQPEENAPVYCLISGDECSDDYITACLTWENDSIKTVPVLTEAFEQEEYASGAIISIMDGRVVLAYHLDLLGTWTAIRDYSLVNGVFTDVSEGFVIIENDVNDAETWEYRGMTLTRELAVSIEGNPAKLPAGTKMLLLGANTITGEVTFFTDGGEIGTFFVTPMEEGCQHMIDGIPEDQWFETLFYAG